MNEKQIGNMEATKLEARMAKLAEALKLEAREQKELYEQILRLEDRLKNVLSPREPQCGAQNNKCDEELPKPAPRDDSPLIMSLDDFGRTIASNTIEINRSFQRLSEIFKRLDI